MCDRVLYRPHNDADETENPVALVRIVMNEIAHGKCVGIIMDGNRRWAKAKGYLKIEGHRAGMETLKKTVRFVRDAGAAHLAVYAFSTENWGREPEEVLALMDLFRELVQKEFGALGKEGIRIRFAGQRERFSPDLQQSMSTLETETEKNDSLTLWVCLSYGGRAEIVAAAHAVSTLGEEITEASISKHLWTAEMPDADIIIRTGGDQRLSNFLTWQSVYSELFFTDSLWPDFSKEEFDSILTTFAARERRRGK